MNACIAYAFFSYHELGCVPQAEPPARNTPYRGQCRIQGIWNISHLEIFAPSYCMQNILKYIIPVLPLFITKQEIHSIHLR